MSKNGKGQGKNKHQMGNLEFTRQAPAFLVALQQKHDPKILSERQEKARAALLAQNDDDPVKEDEAPLVVVLNDGDLNYEQVQAVKEGRDPDEVLISTTEGRKRRAGNADRDVHDGKDKELEDHSDDEDKSGLIKFRKPKKKAKSSNTSKGKSMLGSKGASKSVDPNKRSKVKKISNVSLLSFGDDD
eukprot:CFRG1618T1